jgi:hypothetical protein
LQALEPFMDPSDKSEIIIAAVVFGVYIAFVITRHTCNTIPGSCSASWVVFGIISISTFIFILLKIFRS